MQISLFINLDDVRYYGDIPERFGVPSPQIESISYDGRRYWPLISGAFMDAMNAACGTSLDVGDVEYLDEVKCQRLIDWLGSGVSYESPLLQEFLNDLKRLCEKALVLHTGVVVEL